MRNKLSISYKIITPNGDEIDQRKKEEKAREEKKKEKKKTDLCHILSSHA